MQNKIFFAISFSLIFLAMVILYKAYLFDMLIAFLLCVGSFWLKDFIQKIVKYNILACFISVLLLSVMVFVPVAFVLYQAFISLRKINWTQAKGIFDEFREMALDFIGSIPLLEGYMPTFLNEISFNSLYTYLFKITTFVGENSLRFIIDGSFIIIFLFIFLYFGNRLYAYVCRILPFSNHQIDQVALELSGTIRIVFLATLINVILQGSAFGIITHFFGFDPVLLGIIFGICSMIPIIGGVIVWLPVCAVLIYQGDIKGAIIIAVYSAVFIGFIIDNIIKLCNNLYIHFKIFCLFHNFIKYFIIPFWWITILV